MKTIKDAILEKFIQKEMDSVSGKIANEISSMQNRLAHDIAREEDSEKSDKLKQRYKKLTDLFINLAINSTCAEVSVDELLSVGISIDRILREVVKA